MSKRYYISDIIGDGLTPETAFRAKVSEEITDSVFSIIPSNPDGSPKFTWALCVVDVVNHARLNPITGIDQLPEFPLDGKLSSISQAARSGLDIAIAARGISVTLNSSIGYRDVIDQIGKNLLPEFTVDNFDVQ